MIVFTDSNVNFCLKQAVEIQFKHQNKTKISTIRSQKRRNALQESTENVNEGLISPVLVTGGDKTDLHVMIAGPSRAKSPRNENSDLERLRRLAESQRESAVAYT